MKKDEPDTALGYFEANAPRMRYHWFRQCGLFTGRPDPVCAPQPGSSRLTSPAR